MHKVCFFSFEANFTSKFNSLALYTFYAYVINQTMMRCSHTDLFMIPFYIRGGNIVQWKHLKLFLVFSMRQSSGNYISSFLHPEELDAIISRTV